VKKYQFKFRNSLPACRLSAIQAGQAGEIIGRNLPQYFASAIPPYPVIFDFDKIGTGKYTLRAIHDTYTC